MNSDNPFETLADLERKKKMNQQKGKQASAGQAKSGGKKKPATKKEEELSPQDRYQKEIQKIKDVLPHIPEETVLRQLSELNGNVDLVLMKLLEFDATDNSKNNNSSKSSSSTAKNTPPATKANTTAPANNSSANQGFTQPKYHTKGTKPDLKQSPSEVPKKFAGQGTNPRGYSQEGANNRTYPPNAGTNNYPAKSSAKAPTPQQNTGGRGPQARDSNNYTQQQSRDTRGGSSVLPKGPQPRDVTTKPATVMNYSAAVNRNIPAPARPQPNSQLSAAEALLATLADDDYGEEEYQDFDPRDFLDEGAFGEDYIPDDIDPSELEDDEMTQELNISESTVHTLSDSKEVTINTVTVTADRQLDEAPSRYNGGQASSHHVQEQVTVNTVEVNDKAHGTVSLAQTTTTSAVEFPVERPNANTVPAEAYQQLIVLNIQAAQRIATLETLLQTLATKQEKLEQQNNEMQTVCQQLVKTCLYLSDQQAKVQTAVSNFYSNNPQQQSMQQGGQQPPQAQPPQQPSSFPPQSSNQYPQQYQQPTAQAQSQQPQGKPQGMGPNSAPAQNTQPQSMQAMYQQQNMNKQQQAGFSSQVPHGYPSMHHQVPSHQYGSSPQNQSPLMQPQQQFYQGNQPGFGYPSGMHHNARGFQQFSPQFMQGQPMGLDPEIIEGIVRDQRLGGSSDQL